MARYAGMELTGRNVVGPDSTLVEVQPENGLKHIAIQYEEQDYNHDGLTDDLLSVLGFLEEVDIDGIVRLGHYLPDEGALIYPSGTNWSVAEILRFLGDRGEVCGVRAALEFCYLMGEALTEAAEHGSEVDLYCHGNINPWRTLIKSDGQVCTIGYGVPDVSLARFLESGKLPTQGDSFRYCAPERLESEPNDLSSDLYSVALIGIEMILGQPVYNGLVKDIQQQVGRGDAVRRVYQWRSRLPSIVREVLSKALKPDVDTRYAEGTDFVYAFHDLLSSVDVEGPSLVDIIRMVSAGEKRGRAIEGGRTGTFSKEELKAMVADMEDHDDAPLPPPKRQRDEKEDEPEPVIEKTIPRWERKLAKSKKETPVEKEKEKPKRQRRRTAAMRSEDVMSEDPKSSKKDGLRSRLRRSSRRHQDEEEERPIKASESSNKDRLRARLKGSRKPSERKEEEVPAADEFPDVEGFDPKAARVSRSEDVQPEPEPEPELEPEPVLDPAAALLRRLQGGGDADEEEEVSNTSTTLDSDSSEPDARIVFDVSIAKQAMGSLSLNAGDSLGQAVIDIVGRDGRLPLDLQGELKGWYRIEQDGQLCDPQSLVSELNTDTYVNLAFIENESIRVKFEVHGGDDPLRFAAPVGTCVPVRHLVSHLREWLDLGKGDWYLSVDGIALPSDGILKDRDLVDGTLIVVSR